LKPDLDPDLDLDLDGDQRAHSTQAYKQSPGRLL
jgi:hypothetical protein